MSKDSDHGKVMTDKLSTDEVDVIDKDKYLLREFELGTKANRTKKQRIDVKKAKCDGVRCKVVEVEKFAMYICYLCNIYLCEECSTVHSYNHGYLKMDILTSDREKLSEMLIEEMRNKNFEDRTFYEEKLQVYERVTVKHELDKVNCFISGLSSLPNKRWIVLDSNNLCMKLYSSVTNELLRYVRFGSEPRDATDFTVERFLSKYGSVTDNENVVPGEARMGNISFLAVTFPYIKQIWFIDLENTPARKLNIVALRKQCLSIDSRKDLIFTLCLEEDISRSRWSVDIFSNQGTPVNIIDLDIPVLFTGPDLALYKEKVYVTDTYNNKVLCINVLDGTVISEVTIEGSGPTGICVDQNNKLYVCGYYSDKVYKVSLDLKDFNQLNLDVDFTREPWRMCFTDNKLFVRHSGLSALRNYVTVFQMI